MVRKDVNVSPLAESLYEFMHRHYLWKQVVKCENTDISLRDEKTKQMYQDLADFVDELTVSPLRALKKMRKK